MSRKNRWNRFYGITAAVMVVLLLLPLLFMPAAGFQNAESKDSQTPFPSLHVDGRWNTRFFAELGEYFDFNFAFRNHIITAYNSMMAGIFRTSAEDDVIIGKDGYLFYGDTLNDYQGIGSLDDQKMENIVYNLELLERILGRKNISFVFTIAPNKNSLYEEYMPERYQKLRTLNSPGNNSERFQEQTEGRNLSYVNLFSLFRSHKKALYHKTDSHWNNEGAALAAGALLQALGRQPEEYNTMSFDTRKDFQGDLFHMLYPACRDSEKEIYYNKQWNYTYDTEISSTFDPLITTTNKNAFGKVVVFRDSFGNALLPFLAEEYGEGIFSRAMPITAEDAVRQEAEGVIVEVAERNLALLQEKAPVICSMPEKEVSVPKYILPSYAGTMSEERGEYIHIFGDLDESQSSAGMKTYLYLAGKQHDRRYLLECFRENGSKEDGYGYSVYLNPAQFKADYYEMSLVLAEGDALSLTPIMGKIDMQLKGRNTSADNQEEENGKGNRNSYIIAKKLIGHNIGELIQKIGEPQNYTLGASCLTAGEDGQYRWKDIIVYTQSEQKGGIQVIQEVRKVSGRK